MVSRTVVDTRCTRDATAAGTTPPPIMVCTRSRAARMSASVGAAGAGGPTGAGSAGRACPVIRAIQSLKPTVRSESVRSNGYRSAQGAGRAALVEVERTGCELLVVAADPVQVLAGLRDLAL